MHIVTSHTAFSRLRSAAAAEAPGCWMSVSGSVGRLAVKRGGSGHQWGGKNHVLGQELGINLLNPSFQSALKGQRCLSCVYIGVNGVCVMLRREAIFTLFPLGSPVFVLVLHYLCFFASMSITARGFSARGLILLSSWLRDNGNFVYA